MHSVVDCYGEATRTLRLLVVFNKFDIGGNLILSGVR